MLFKISLAAMMVAGIAGAAIDRQLYNSKQQIEGFAAESYTQYNFTQYIDHSNPLPDQVF